jgi:phenylpyruvate tautomerase PptA (4-oxalocrotonate tautomerase family)
MPYLQLDVPGHHSAEDKRCLARRFGDIFARIMQSRPEQVTVAIRDLGEGGLWRCGAGEPEPAALLMCDVRRGRPPEQRAELAEALIAACVEQLGLRRDRLAVEFTQHAGDEMYKAEQGGLGADWTPDEATNSD